MNYQKTNSGWNPAILHPTILLPVIPQDWNEFLCPVFAALPPNKNPAKTLMISKFYPIIPRDLKQLWDLQTLSNTIPRGGERD